MKNNIQCLPLFFHKEIQRSPDKDTYVLKLSYEEYFMVFEYNIIDDCDKFMKECEAIFTCKLIAGNGCMIEEHHGCGD